MPRPEPHPRRTRPARRAAAAVAALGVLVLSTPGVAGAQVPPLLTSTTEAPEETTTTTEAPPATTTTTTTEADGDQSPATTLRTTTTLARSTTTTAPDDEVDEVDEVEAEQVDDTVPPETSTTLRDLLVPGDGTDGAELTTTSTTAAPEVAADGALDEEAQVWLIVAGLVAVALLIGAWTVRFWRRTRPAGPQDDGDADPTTVF